jgi:hypothetical protein
MERQDFCIFRESVGAGRCPVVPYARRTFAAAAVPVDSGL